MRRFWILLAFAWLCLPTPLGAGVEIHYWKKLGSWDLISNSIAIDPLYPGTIYASFHTVEGYPPLVYRITDAGATWTPITAGLPNKDVITLSVNGGRLYAAVGVGGGIYRSTDQGASWAAGTYPSGGWNYVNTVAVDPLNSNVAYAGTYKGIMKSTDGGATWKAMNSGMSSYADVYAIAINPTDNQIVYAGCNHYSTAVYKSVNGGASWSPAITGLPAPSVDTDVSSLAIDPDNPQVLYLGMDGSGIYKSTDAGSSWYQATAANPEMATFGVGALAIDPVNTSIVFAGMKYPGYGVYRSTDDGVTWSTIQGPGTIYTLAVDPVNGRTLYLGGLYGISMTTGPELTFEPPEDISKMPDGLATMAAMAMDANGKVHIAFVGWYVQVGAPDGVASEIYYTNNVGGSFSAPLKLPGSGIGYYSKEPAIAVDALGKVHIAYYRTDVQLAGSGTLCYTTNAGGSFSAPYHGFTFADSHSPVTYAYAISLEVNASNQVFIATDAVEAMLTFGSGTNFSELTPIAPGLTEYWTSDPVLRTDGNRKMHILFSAQNKSSLKIDLRYTNNTGGSFFEPVIVLQTELFFAPAYDLEIDRTGVAHIASRLEATTVYYMNNESGVFSEPVPTTAWMMQDLETGSGGGLYMAAKMAGSDQSLDFYEWRDGDFINLAPPPADYGFISSQWNGGWFQADEDRALFHFVYTTGQVEYVQARHFGTRSLSQRKATFASAGGQGSYDVTLAGCGSCPWNVVSTASWLSVTSPLSGYGSATISYSVAANHGARRIGKLIVGGLTFTVTQNAAGPPAKATLVSPSGIIYTTTPTYVWNAISSATWYYLWVNDSAGGSGKIAIWYTAEESGCGSGTGTCSVTPSVALAPGAAQWWIQTWNPDGYGPWSDGMSFTVSGPPQAASEILPFGTSGSAPNFIWSEVSSASWYYLWVNGPSGTPVIQQWYTATQAKCGNGDCAVPAATTLADGAYTWWVQTWNSSGYGPWSTGMSFNVSGCKPGATMLIEPLGSAGNPPPWYWWYDVGNASWYYLWVNGPSGAPAIQQWYTSAQANCDGKWCWVTNATKLPSGTNTWWVETWNSCGYGPWSAGKSFTVPATIVATSANPRR